MSDVTVETLQAELDAAEALAKLTGMDADIARVADLVAELAAAQAPPPPPPPPIEQEPVIEPVAGPRVRQYIPSTGRQISAFLNAVANDMPDAHYASEAEVEAFAAGHK